MRVPLYVCSIISEWRKFSLVNLDFVRGACRGAVLLHGVGDLVSLGRLAQEEAVVTHVEVETLLAVVPEANNGADLPRYSFEFGGVFFPVTN